MPGAIPAVAAWAAKTFTWKAVGMFVLKTTLLSAASFGLAKLLAKKPNGLSGGGGSGARLDASRDIMQAMRVIYGRDRVGHTVRLRHKAGVGGEYLYYIAVWAGHECDAIEQEFFGEDELTFDGGGNATGKYAGVIRRTHHLGAHDQTADTNFTTEIPSIWTAAHRLRGRCYTAYRFKWDANKFPGGLQALTAVIRGRKIYDPRDAGQDIADPSTWLWSANPALCLADYLRGVPYLNGAAALVRRFGLRLADDRINWTVATASANACDEAVPLDAGGDEPRYECHGSFDTDSDHSTVITSIESSMAGRSLFTAGEAYIRAGVWNAPDFDITEAMIRRGQRRTRNPLSRREKFNRVSGSFVSPTERYKRMPFPLVKSDTFITADGGELPREMDLPFTQSVTMAQRIARQAMLRSRQGTLYQFPCNLKALPALTGENVRITRASLGWTNKHFEVIQMDFKMERGDRGGVGFALDLTGQSTASSIYDWSTSLEGPIGAPGSPSLHDPSVVETPAGLTLATSNFLQADGTITPRLKVTFTAPTDRFVISGGLTEIEYKKTADATWLIWNSKLRGDANEDYILDVLAGVSYDVRVRHVNSFKVEGAFCTPVAHTVSTDTTVPAAPTGLVAVATVGSVTLDWANNSESDRAEYGVYRHSADVPGSATLIWRGRASAYSDLKAPAGATSYYWVTCFDTSNNESPKSTVASATPNPATGNFFDYIFKRAASIPSTPTGDGLPATWSDTPPAADGNPLWMSAGEKTVADVLVGTWSTPIRLDGAAGATGATGATGSAGADGDDISVEYSVDGVSSWHGTFTAGDFYMRIQIGSGGFGAAIKISGEISAGEITTVMIENEAVTTASSSYTSGSVGYDTSFDTVQSVNIDCDGGPVNIWWTFFRTTNFINFHTVRILCDGSQIWASPAYPMYSGPHGGGFSHAPSAGNHTYDLQVQSSSGSVSCEDRMLMVVNFKR